MTVSRKRVSGFLPLPYAFTEGGPRLSVIRHHGVKMESVAVAFFLLYTIDAVEVESVSFSVLMELKWVFRAVFFISTVEPKRSLFHGAWFRRRNGSFFRIMLCTSPCQRFAFLHCASLPTPVWHAYVPRTPVATRDMFMFVLLIMLSLVSLLSFDPVPAFL